MYISENCNWTPYGTDPRLDKMVDDDSYNIREEVAKQGYGLDKLINDENYYVRQEVAKQGYGLDILINDKSLYVRKSAISKAKELAYDFSKYVNSQYSEVREEVAKQGYSLDILINDKSRDVRDSAIRKAKELAYDFSKYINSQYLEVRTAVAGQGCCLDILINDENQWVRAEVAEQGYGLDILVNDKYNMVRAKVVEQGYGLDILINDEDWFVRDCVRDYLKSHNLTINQWIEQNPDKCVLEHKDSQVEKITRDFIHKIDDSNKLTVQSQFDSIDEFFSTEIEDDSKMNKIVICTVDTRIPLFRIEKSKSDNQADYKFIIDITTDKGEHFNIEAFIQSQEQLNKLIQQTVDALNLYEQFSKYADDLENCL